MSWHYHAGVSSLIGLSYHILRMFSYPVRINKKSFQFDSISNMFPRISPRISYDVMKRPPNTYTPFLFTNLYNLTIILKIIFKSLVSNYQQKKTMRVTQVTTNIFLSLTMHGTHFTPEKNMKDPGKNMKDPGKIWEIIYFYSEIF